MKKKFGYVLIALLLIGCSSKLPPQTAESLPEKSIAESTRMSESPINPLNLDQYLFREDTMYVDTREINQWLEEGHVAGFINIPFYQAIANIKTDSGVLYSFDRIRDSQGNTIATLGASGSFSQNYEESQSIIYSLFPKDKNIIVLSTAGVEASYLIGLLLQLGYDGSKIYNAGSFSNSFGSNIAYRDYKDAKYLIAGTNVYTLDYKINFGELTPKK